MTGLPFYLSYMARGGYKRALHLKRLTLKPDDHDHPGKENQDGNSANFKPDILSLSFVSLDLAL